MHIFQQQIANPLSPYPREWFPDPDGTVFFDIETTGLSWRNSHLYLLGAVFSDGGQWFLKQWFCQRPSEEATVLKEFQDLLRGRRLLVHFNGRGFDLPYLMHKYTFYRMEAPFEALSFLALPVIAGLTGSMSHKYHLKTNERVAAENLLREIASELSARGVGFRIRGRALLLEFLVLVARSEERGWHHVDYRLEAIHKAVIFMEQHLDEHLTLQDISRSAGLGKHYFREFFQLETGYSPWSYLLMLRLERAKKLLKESDLPILEVALKAGFCDQSYMARAFRRQEGITPRAYRMQFRRFQEIFPGNDATNHITLPDCPGIPAGGGDGRFLEKKEILPE